MKLVHRTSMAHYTEYKTITGGEGRAKLRKLVMEMIGGDVEALREAYIEDKHLNNIDKVLKKAGTFATISMFASSKNYHKQRKAMHEDFKSRCLKNNISTKAVSIIDRGGYQAGSWFLTFDLKLPEFFNYTKEGRKKWSEISGKSGGVSPSTIVSGLKHVMIFDILGCEFEQEVR